MDVPACHQEASPGLRMGTVRWNCGHVTVKNWLVNCKTHVSIHISSEKQAIEIDGKLGF